MCVCVCVAKPVAVELRCHATALILVIGKAQFRRAMLSCDSSCLIFGEIPKQTVYPQFLALHLGLYCLPMSQDCQAYVS